MPTRIKRWFLPPVFEDKDKTHTAGLLHVILWAIIALLTVNIISSLFTPPANVALALSINGTGLGLAVVALYLVRIGYVRAISYTFTVLLWGGITLTNLGYRGLRGTGYNSYATIILVAGLLLGGRAAIGYAVASAVAGGVMYYLESQALISPDPSSLEMGSMFNTVTPRFFIVALLIYFSHRGMTEALARARRNEQALAESNETLQATRASLEKRVAERTANLEAVSFVAREAAAIRDVEQLLKATANLISERFGFYYTGLFLLDEAGEYAALRAASEGGGQRMLAQGHRMPVGRGIVGTVAAQGEYRIALDVDVDTEFVANPDLPHTRSEVALPLKARERVIGVLDVQSTEPEAFSDENVSVLQMLSDQVAVALDNVLLLRQVRESLEAERRMYGEAGREAWATLARTRSDLSHRYDPNGILPSDQQWSEEMKQVMQKGETIVRKTQDGESGTKTTLTIPLKPRGDLSIGVLDAHAPEGVEWTQDEVAALETLAEQLAVALDSARLYEDSRRRAAYQQLTREITDHIRAATSVEEAVQRAIQEMGRALGASELVAHVGTRQDLLSRHTQVEVNQEEESQG